MKDNDNGPVAVATKAKSAGGPSGATHAYDDDCADGFTELRARSQNAYVKEQYITSLGGDVEPTGNEMMPSRAPRLVLESLLVIG